MQVFPVDLRKSRAVPDEELGEPRFRKKATARMILLSFSSDMSADSGLAIAKTVHMVVLFRH